MATGNAEAIFETFRKFRTSGGLETPEEQFDPYCKEVLSSVEKQHFDYKTKHDSRNPNLNESDKKNLAKAISGFANTGGGVLLWGVNEGPPPTLQAITGVETFLKRLLDLAGQATDPRVQGIDGEWLPSKADPTAGYAALLIPESQLPPHRVILKLKEVQHHYYVRTASNFDIASHIHLEDMFGRRPQPKLITRGGGQFACVRTHARPAARTPEYKWKITFDIANVGRGTAKLVYVEFSHQDGMSVVSSNLGWSGSYSTVNQESNSATITFALTPERVLHPGMALRFDALELKDSPLLPRPSEQPVQFPCRLYCEGAAPVHTTIEGKLQEWQGQG